MIFITWKSVNYDRNCEYFENMSEVTKFIEDNSLLEAMSNIIFIFYKR